MSPNLTFFWKTLVDDDSGDDDDDADDDGDDADDADDDDADEVSFERRWFQEEPEHVGVKMGRR